MQFPIRKLLTIYLCKGVRSHEYETGKMEESKQKHLQIAGGNQQVTGPYRRGVAKAGELQKLPKSEA